MKKTMMMSVFACFLFATVFLLPTSAEEPAPYVIGVPVDLSGFAAFLGTPIERVFRMRAAEINAAGGVNGRPLKLIILDNETRPEKTVMNTKKLINVDKAIALVGYTTSGSTLATVQTATADEIVLFSCASSDRIWVPTKKWVFNVVPRSKEACAPMMVDNLRERGSRKIAYMVIDNAMGQAALDAFQWYMGKIGMKPAVIEKYAPGTTDVSTQVTHVKSSGADGLFIDGLAADTALAVRTARDLGFKSPINCGYGIVGPEFIHLAGKDAEGILSTSLKALVAHDLPDNDPQKQIAVDLYDKYTKEYGEFSLYGGHAWDALSITAKALENVDPNLDPTNDKDLKKIRADLRDNIEKIKNFHGQNGVFNYSPDNHNGLPLGCYVDVVVKDGKWRLYDKVKQDM